MLVKIIRSLMLLLSLVMFLYSFFMDGSVKEFIFWGILLILNFISISTDHIIKNNGKESM